MAGRSSSAKTSPSRARRETAVKDLMQKLGGRFSVALGIGLSSHDPGELFKWFFASILFGARISEVIVIHTYREFEKAGVLSPHAILKTGWDGLVEILDRGGYVRYDFKTATKMLEVSKAVLDRYNGDLNLAHANASDPRDLEERLKAIGKGIGEVTVNIFLREMRGIWQKAEPLPSELVVMAARNRGIIPAGLKDREKVLWLLKKKWADEGMKMKDFPDFEAALLRLGKDYCKKTACRRCPAAEDCRAGRRS
jgi:endonuclease III